MSAIFSSLFANPKTTLGGVLNAVGIYLAGQPGAWAIAGQVLMAVGTLIIGAAAKDAATKAAPTP